MQSDETLRKLGTLDRELIETRIHTLFAMRRAGDLRGMLSYAADDVVYNLRGNWAAFPYSRPVRGKKLVGEAMTMFVVQYESLGSVVHELVVDGDRVAVRRTSKLRHRGTGKVGEIDIADFIRFRDGLIVEFTEVADSMALAQLEDS